MKAFKPRRFVIVQSALRRAHLYIIQGNGSRTAINLIDTLMETGRWPSACPRCFEEYRVRRGLV